MDSYEPVKELADGINRIVKDLAEAKIALYTFLFWVEEWMDYYGLAGDMLTEQQAEALAIARRLVGDNND